MLTLKEKAENVGLHIETVKSFAFEVTKAFAGSGSDKATPTTISELYSRMIAAQIEVHTQKD